jgi:hypothetical protein
MPASFVRGSFGFASGCGEDTENRGGTRHFLAFCGENAL